MIIHLIVEILPDPQSYIQCWGVINMHKLFLCSCLQHLISCQGVWIIGH